MVINAECGKTVRIAYQGENNRQQVRFDLSDIMAEFPGGTAVLAILRSGDTDPVPAAEVELDTDGKALVWTVTAWECAVEGFVYAQVTYAVDQVVAKTRIWRFDVKNSLVVSAAEPEEWADLVGQLVTAAAGVNTAIEAAEEQLRQYVADAEAAESAAAQSATAAGTAQAAAETAQRAAEAAVASYDAMTATATGLAAGSAPTAEIDHSGSAPVLRLGIPAGERGPAGPAGPKGDPGEAADVIDDTAASTDKTFSSSKLEQQRSDLLNAITSLDNSKAPIIIDSASGAIATFPDGADDLPVESMTVQIEPVQSGSGDPSPDNVRPISGWTGCNVTRCGKNLLPKLVDGTYTGNGVTAVVKDGVITLSGTTTASGNAFSIPLSSVATVPPGAYIHLLNSVANASVAPSFELSTDVSGTAVAPACSPANRIYQTNKTDTVTWDRIRFYLWNGVAVSGTLSPMLCLDDVVSDFVPFARYDTYPVTWQSAGTVYGGTVNPITGKLIVTDAEIESYNGETLPSTWISDRDVYAEGTTPTIGAQVVYKLAEPLVYDLSDLPTITTLLGSNAIWADTGNVAVDYRADTRLYVERMSVSGGITVDTALSSTSTNPVQNKVINTALSGKEPKHNTVTVSGATPNISGVADTRYICGECSTLTITAPASGCIDVTFTSGSTPTVLTVNSAKANTTVKWANGFDPTSLDANTTYEINIMDGCLGVAVGWT